MKNWILILLISLTLPFIYAYGEENHIGCQEGEVINGECIVAKNREKNMDLFSKLASIDVETKDVDYGTGFPGFLAKSKKDGIYPGIIMIHEWWGLNENIKDMAKLLANEGYVVLAVDLYSGESAKTSDKAMILSTDAMNNPDKTIKNMKLAVSYLKSTGFVNPDKIASIGWCFGGGQSLNLAVSGEKLAATVIYYGSLDVSKEKLSNISWPVLGIFGEKDSYITVSAVNTFRKNLNSLGIENEIYIYPGVGHAFANPSGGSYAPDQTLDAWNKTIKFLERNLK